MDYIKQEKLVIGGIYRLKARNLYCGVWNGQNFVGIREKFGERYLTESEVPFSTAFAIEKLGMVSPSVQLRAHLLVENAALRYELEPWDKLCEDTYEPMPYPREITPCEK